MKKEQLFNHKAENYVKGRPGYAPEAVTCLCNSLLFPGAKVADIGSGTGIFTVELLQRGYAVYGVEPNAEMRTQAELLLAAFEGFFSVAARAEKTGLPSSSIDLVTAASSFHWFEETDFQAECRRIRNLSLRIFLGVRMKSMRSIIRCIIQNSSFCVAVYHLPMLLHRERRNIMDM